MSGRFIDSNVLVCADDERDASKQEVALATIERALIDGNGFVSTQVLSEYFVATTRRLSIPREVAREKVELFARMHVVALDSDAVLAAIDLHRLHRVSFWDGLIFRAAQLAGCDEILSEDLAGGSSISGIRIRNPFVSSPPAMQERSRRWGSGQATRRSRRRPGAGA